MILFLTGIPCFWVGCKAVQDEALTKDLTPSFFHWEDGSDIWEEGSDIVYLFFTGKRDFHEKAIRRANNVSLPSAWKVSSIQTPYR